MDDDRRETLLDRWTRRAKQNPVIAVVLLVAGIVGGLAAFTNSLKSLESVFKGAPEPPKVTPATPAIRVFQTRPEEVRPGDFATIEWNVDAADSVQIDGGIGAVPLSGSRQVNPSKTTTYTLTANNRGVVVTSATTLRVAAGSAFDGGLALNDVFVGDAGWKQPQDSVFRGSIGGGRFRMELAENRSGTCVTRDLAIGAGQDFSIQATAQAVQPTGYYLGLCWTASGGQATHMLYVSPGTSSKGTYMLLRSETWSQVAPDGQPHPYGQTVNLLDPGDANHVFQSTAISSGTAPNVLTVVRRADKLRIFINDQFVNQANYIPAPIDGVGMFIAGQLAADFRDFRVRVAQ